jgi:hypothetical protein
MFVQESFELNTRYRIFSLCDIADDKMGKCSGQITPSLKIFRETMIFQKSLQNNALHSSGTYTAYPLGGA